MIRSSLGVTIVPSLVRPILDGSLVLVALRETDQRRLVMTGPRRHEWHPAITALMDRVVLQRF